MVKSCNQNVLGSKIMINAAKCEPNLLNLFFPDSGFCIPFYTKFYFVSHYVSASNSTIL